MKMQPCQATLCLLLLLLLAAPTYSGELPTKPSPTNTVKLTDDPTTSVHVHVCNVTCNFQQNTFECLLNGQVPNHWPFKKCSEIIIEDVRCTNTRHTITPSSCSEKKTTSNTPISSFSTSTNKSSSTYCNTPICPALATTIYTCSPTSCGPVAMDTATTQYIPKGHTNCPGYTSVVTTTTTYTTTFSPTITTSCGPVAMDTLPATLHGVYMTVLLVLVAVTITMTTLVVYMCLMMRRAKNGRVPQTTTGTTHANNMAASDYCEPISLRHFQNTNGEPMYTEPVDTLQQHPHNCQGTKLESAASQDLNNSCYGCDQPDHSTHSPIPQPHDQSDHLTHPPLPQPPTSDNVYNAAYEPTSTGSHEYEIVDELRKNDRGNTTGEVHVAVEGVEREKEKKEEEEKQEEEEEKKEEEKEEKEDNEDNGTTEKP